MKILALDTSSKAASCALFQGKELLGEYFLNAGITHSQTILPMVEHLMRTSGHSLESVDIIAVSHGPGSFTGLRIGISTVKGMALALNIPVVGVSTLLGLAHNIAHLSGMIVPAMDARRQNLYTGIFRSDGHKLTSLLGDSNLPISTLGEHIKTLRLSNEPVYLVGDGAMLTADGLLETIPALQLAPATLLHQRASSLCLAAKEIILTTGTQTPADLEPAYLRITQAERERQERLRQNHSETIQII